MSEGKEGGQNLGTRTYWEQRYEKEYKREVNPWFLKFMEKHKKEIGPEVLDIGCGAGRNLLPLAKEGYRVTGIDFIEKALEDVKEKLDKEGLEANLVLGDSHNLPIDNEKMDTVVSHQSFQFNDWQGAEECFAEATRVLKPGGLFYLRVRSDKRALPEKYERLDDKGITIREERNGNIITYHHYSLEEIKELADKNGLEIIENPVDARDIKEDGEIERGQWNVVLRKKEIKP